jgi:hypothetical protein
MPNAIIHPYLRIVSPCTKHPLYFMSIHNMSTAS